MSSDVQHTETSTDGTRPQRRPATTREPAAEHAARVDQVRERTPKGDQPAPEARADQSPAADKKPKPRDEYGAGAKAWRLLDQLPGEQQTRVMAAASAAINGLRGVDQAGAEIVRTLLALTPAAAIRQLEVLRDRWQEQAAESARDLVVADGQPPQGGPEE